MNKTVLITGASAGLGLETALLFAGNAYKVYAGMRNTAKQDALLSEASKRNVAVEVTEMDVCNVSSIENAVQYMLSRENKIDILINNAGAGFAKTTEHASDEEIRWVMETNYLSVVRCTKAVLPAMRKQRSGHIINISSVGGLVGQPFNELYCAAKFAVEGYTEALATYLPQTFNIKFTVVEPGGIATGFGKSATQKTLGAGLPDDEYLPVIQKYISGMQKRASSGESQTYQQPGEVAQVILDIALSGKNIIRTRTSEWAENLCSYKTQADLTGNLQNEKIIKQFLGDE